MIEWSVAIIKISDSLKPVICANVLYATRPFAQEEKKI